MHTATFEKGKRFDQLNVVRRQHWLAVSPKRLERCFEIQLVAVGKLKLPVRSVAAQMNAGDMELIKGSCLCHRMEVKVRYNTLTYRDSHPLAVVTMFTFALPFLYLLIAKVYHSLPQVFPRQKWPYCSTN